MSLQRCTALKHKTPPVLLMLLAVAVLVAATPAATLAQVTRDSRGECATALDCSLLGDCVDGRCLCAEGFTGLNCQYPDLIPAPSLNGFDSPEYPTWGGMSIYAEGKWHFVAEYIVNRCDIWDYGTNSAFLRAEADNPVGPFTFAEQMVPPFHHGAQVHRGADGSYLVFGDGRDMPSSTVKKNCNVFQNRGRALLRGSNQKRGGGGSRGNLYPRGNSPNDVHMVMVSNKITGPWEQHIIAKTDLSNPRAWDCNITNLSPVIVDRNRIVVAFRSKPCVNMAVLSERVCGKQCQNIGIMESENGWAGPFVKRPDPIRNLAGNEDPFMWKDSRGWHMIMHGKTQCGPDQSDTNTCGTMAYSEDSYTWYHSPFPFYDGKIVFDGTGPQNSEVLELRHRPKITFDNYGTPLVLYTSAKRFSRAYVQNVAVAFNTNAMRNYQAPPSCPRQYTKACTVNPVSRKKRDADMCKAMGPNRCVWCGNVRECRSGSDRAICASSQPELFYAHC